MHAVCEVALGAYRGHDLGGGIEVVGEHHVGWDEELEYGSVAVNFGRQEENRRHTSRHLV